MTRNTRIQRKKKMKVVPKVRFSLELKVTLVQGIDMAVERGGLDDETFDNRADFFRKVIEQYLTNIGIPA